MSKPNSRFLPLSLSLILLLGVANLALAKDITIAYPTPEDPDFTVTAPESWEMTPGEEAGDYFLLEGPSGAVLSFRSFEGTRDDLNEAIEFAENYLEETYANVQIAEAKEQGKNGFYASGTGKYKDDGTACVFELAWYILANGQIAEIWYEAAKNDTAGLKQAKKILSTFRGL